jgi:hypothetical protein
MQAMLARTRQRNIQMETPSNPDAELQRWFTTRFAADSFSLVGAVGSLMQQQPQPTEAVCKRASQPVDVGAAVKLTR